MATTVANEWEIIDFDFTGELANAYNKIVVFFDPGKDGVDNDGETIDHDGVTLGYSDFTFYYDDVELVASGALANNFSSLVDGVKIYAAGKSVKLENLEKVLNGSIDVYNITGQKVANKQISNNSESLELSQSGLYIVLISDKNGSKLKADKLFVN